MNSISSVQQQYTKLGLTSISDFSLSSEVATMQQTDGAAYKLKPRSFHKSTQLRVYSVDFYPSVNCAWQHSNLLYTRASRAIVNYAPISEYQLRFFPKEEFKYLYRVYPIKIRWYILHECRRYSNYWNSRKDTIAHFTLFLEFNSSTFSFRENIT